MGDDIKVNQIGLKPPEPKKSTVTTKKLSFESEEEAQKYMKERQAVAKDSKGQTSIQLRQMSAQKLTKQTAQEAQQARAAHTEKAHEVSFKKALPAQDKSTRQLSNDVELPAASMRQIDNKVLKSFLSKTGGAQEVLNKMDQPEFRQRAVAFMSQVPGMADGKVDKWALLKLLLEMAHQNQEINKVIQNASGRVSIASASLNVVAAKIDLYQQQMQARYALAKHSIDQTNAMYGMGGLLEKAKDCVVKLLEWRAEAPVEAAEHAIRDNQATITAKGGPPLGNPEAERRRTALQDAVAANPQNPQAVADAEARFWESAPPEAIRARDAYRAALATGNPQDIAAAARRLDAATGEVVRHQTTLSSPTPPGGHSQHAQSAINQARGLLATACQQLGTARGLAAGLAARPPTGALATNMTAALQTYRTLMGAAHAMTHPDMTPEESQRVIDVRVQRRGAEALNESRVMIEPIRAREQALESRSTEIDELLNATPGPSAEARAALETEKTEITAERAALRTRRETLSQTAELQLAPIRDYEDRVVSLITRRSELRGHGHAVPPFDIPPPGSDTALAAYNAAVNETPPDQAKIERTGRAFEATMRPTERAYEAAHSSHLGLSDPVRDAIPGPGDPPSASDRSRDPPATDTSPRAVAIRAYRASQDNVGAVDLARARISPPVSETDRSGDATATPPERRAAILNFRAEQDQYAVRVARHSGATPTAIREAEVRAEASARACVPGAAPSATDRTGDAAETGIERSRALLVYRARQDALGHDVPLSTPHMQTWARRADAKADRTLLDQHIRVEQLRISGLAERDEALVRESTRLEGIPDRLAEITGSRDGVIPTPPGGRLGTLATERSTLEAERTRTPAPTPQRLQVIDNRLAAITTERTALESQAASMRAELPTRAARLSAIATERATITSETTEARARLEGYQADRTSAQNRYNDADRVLGLLDTKAPHSITGEEWGAISAAFIGAEPQRAEEERRTKDLVEHRARVRATEAELTALVGSPDGVVTVPTPGSPATFGGGELGALRRERETLAATADSPAKRERLASIDARVTAIETRRSALVATRTTLVAQTQAKQDAAQAAHIAAVQGRAAVDLAIRHAEIRSEYRTGTPPAIPAAMQGEVTAMITSYDAAANSRRDATVAYLRNGGELDPLTNALPDSNTAFDPYNWRSQSAFEAIPEPRPSWDVDSATPGSPNEAAVTRFIAARDLDVRTRAANLAYDAIPGEKPSITDRSLDGSATTPERRAAILRFRQEQDGYSSVTLAAGRIVPPLSASEESNRAGDAAITPDARRNAVLGYRQAKDRYEIRRTFAEIPPPIPAPTPPATGAVSPTDRTADPPATDLSPRAVAIRQYRAAQDTSVRNARALIPPPTPPPTPPATGEVSATDRSVDPPRTDTSPRAIAIRRYRNAQTAAEQPVTPLAIEPTPRTRDALYTHLFGTPPHHPAIAALSPQPTAAQLSDPSPANVPDPATREAIRAYNRDKARWDATTATTNMIPGEYAAARGWRPADATEFARLLGERERLANLVPAPPPSATEFPIASDHSPRAEAIRALRTSELALAQHQLAANARTFTPPRDISSAATTALSQREPRMLALANAEEAVRRAPTPTPPDLTAAVTRARRELGETNQTLRREGAVSTEPRAVRQALAARDGLRTEMENARALIPPPGVGPGIPAPASDDTTPYAVAVRAYRDAEDAYNRNEEATRPDVDRSHSTDRSSREVELERTGWNTFTHGLETAVLTAGRFVDLFGNGRGGTGIGLIQIGWDIVQGYERAANAIGGIRAELFGQMDQTIAEAHAELGRAEAQNIADMEKKMALCKKLVEGIVSAG